MSARVLLKLLNKLGKRYDARLDRARFYLSSLLANFAPKRHDEIRIIDLWIGLPFLMHGVTAPSDATSKYKKGFSIQTPKLILAIRLCFHGTVNKPYEKPGTQNDTSVI